MRKLKEVVARPSAFDSLANYVGTVPDDEWLCLLTQNRDSGTLTRSNFQAALAKLGGKSDNVQVFGFNHWACGWWEALAVKAGTKEAETAQAIADAIEDYPVVDEEHFSNLEYTEAQEYWQRASVSERKELCKRWRVSLSKAHCDELPETPTGELCTWPE